MKRAMLCLLAGMVLQSCDSAGTVRVMEKHVREVFLSNGRVLARFKAGEGGVEQDYYAIKSRKWELVGSSFVPPRPRPAGGNALYDSSRDPANRLIVTEILQAVSHDGKNRVTLMGESHGHKVVQTVSLLPGEGFFHVEVSVELASPRVEYVLSPFEFAIEGKPDVTHAPSLKRGAEYVIGDRVFWAPAALAQQGGKFAAVVPDVGMMNEHAVYAKDARPQTHPKVFAVPVDPDKVAMPMALDLEMQSGLTEKPVMSYGMMDVIAEQHVFWRHDNTPGAMVRELSGTKINYGFDLFVAADAPPHRGYQRVAAHHWERYGHDHFMRPRPQAMPLEEYARVCYPAYFAYQGYDIAPGSQGLVHRSLPGRRDMDSWQEWEENGTRVGGWRLSAPQWYDLVYFTPWWNNVTDAVGMHHWGKRLGDDALVEKARRAVNLALTSPQREGMFPSLYHLREKRWIGSLFHPPEEGYDPSRRSVYWDFDHGVYQTSAASTTAMFLLKYRAECEELPGVLEYVKRYGDFLVERLQPNGCVPAWFSEELEPLESLKWNAEGGIHAAVLAELYRVTKEKKYLHAAERMAEQLIAEVLPTQRWSDFETFYSCAVKEETFFDPRTGQPGRDMMSVYWAMEGLTALHGVTGEAKYLDAAEAAADFVSLYQAVWAPDYVITAYPFGGCSSQLGDADWLDQRSHLLAGATVKIGLLRGRRDLMERGVAMARSSLTLTSHPRHKANDIYTYTDFPVGLGPENIDHEGFPQKPLSSGPSWSSVGGLYGAAEVTRLLGGVYVDAERLWGVGADGVTVEEVKVKGDTLHVKIGNPLGKLPMAYEKPYGVTLRIGGLKKNGAVKIVVNGGEPVMVFAKTGGEVRLVVDPGRNKGWEGKLGSGK